MPFKSIFTVVTDIDRNRGTIDAALELARANGGHLDVLALGVDRTEPGVYYAGANAMIVQETLARARNDAEEISEAVETRLRPEDVPWGLETGVVSYATLRDLVSSRARFADLVLLPRPYDKEAGREEEMIVESCLFDAGAPVLIVPHGATVQTSPAKVVVGWNQGAEALRAIRAAMPFLVGADTVDIAIVAPPEHGEGTSDPGGPLSQLLSRHGARPEVSILPKTLPRVSEVLARRCEDVNAGLMVMGAYGHSRLREAIIGGATRNTLEYAKVPVLLAH